MERTCEPILRTLFHGFLPLWLNFMNNQASLMPLFRPVACRETSGFQDGAFSRPHMVIKKGKIADHRPQCGYLV
jgi:hypothetical protein